MELSVAIDTIESNIVQKSRHRDYARVVKMAEKYQRLITGEDIGPLLKRFIKREDEEMFKQREELTQLITPALANGVIAPYYDVSRNNKVVKRIEIADETKRKQVIEMARQFYGDNPDVEGFESYLQSRFVQLSFSDPNTWIVFEFDEFDNTQEAPKPRPFEVPAADAINFSISANQTAEWLLCKTDISVLRLKGSYNQQRFPERYQELQNKAVALQTYTGTRYTLYTDTIAVVYEQVDRDYVVANPDIVPEGSKLVDLDPLYRKKDMLFIQTVSDPGIGFVPAYRIGYMPDLVTKGRTFVNPFQPGMPFFMKSVKSVSELDLTITLHTFPIRLQYVRRCRGTLTMPCNNGRCLDETDCRVCNGKGFVIPTTTQEVINIPMPDTEEEMRDLTKLIAYSSPPPDIIEFLDGYIDKFEGKIHKAVFNSEVFITATNVKTATEKRLEMQSVWRVLSPFAKQVSLFYKFGVRVFMKLADVDVDSESTKVLYNFPPEFDNVTIDMLVEQLKLMNDSGAPSFVKDKINDGIAELIYQSDPNGYLRYKSQKSFNPFPGKSELQIESLMASEYVTTFNKVLYANFEAIFADIERDDAKFYIKDYNAQWKVVEAKTKEIVEELEGDKTQRFNDAMKNASIQRTEKGIDDIEDGDPEEE